MRRAKERDERFVVGSKGEPQIVIMGIRDFLTTIAPEHRAMARIRASAQKKGAVGMSMSEINREIRRARRRKKLNGAGTPRRS